MATELDSTTADCDTLCSLSSHDSREGIAFSEPVFSYVNWE